MCEYNELLKETMPCAESESLENKRIKGTKKIKDIVPLCSRFKIGKTGQDLKARFDSEYKERYDRIEEVHSSSKKKEVDKLEKDLIEYFQNSDEYSSKCDNEQTGGGEMDIESGTYFIYVVVKD
jgi:hypothetical protein